MRKLVPVFVFALSLAASAAASDIRAYEKGTVVRMDTASCISRGSHFMAAMSGTQVRAEAYDCWEYTLVGDKVVYRITIRKNRGLLPLAEHLLYRLSKGEMFVRPDDSDQEFRFEVAGMMLRSDWENAERNPGALVPAACFVDAAGRELCPAADDRDGVRPLRSRVRLVDAPH